MFSIELCYKLVFCIIIILFVDVKLSAQNNKLKLDNVVKSGLSGKQKEFYSIDVETNQSVYVVVQQNGIDIIATIYDPQGQKIFEVDSPNGIEGPEPVFFTTSSNGTYILEVSSLDPEAKFGKYEVHLKEQRVSYLEDEKIILIRKLFVEAESLRIERKDLDKALEKYKTILKFYGELKSSEKYSKNNSKELFAPSMEQLILVSTAEVLMFLEKYNESIEVYKQALGIYEKTSIDLRGQANCLSNIATNEKLLGNYEKSLKIYSNALALYRQIEDHHGELIINNNIGSIYDLIGEKKLARQHYLEALKLAEPLNDPDLPAIYNNLGLVYEDLEEHQKALNYYEKSLEMYKKAGRSWNVGVVLSNIGIVYDNLGDYARSLTCYKDAIEKFEEAKTLISKAKTLVNMGVVYSKKTDFNNADECYKKALEIFKNKNDLQGQASVLTKIASLSLPMYDYEKKLSLLKEALNLRQTCLDLYGEAYTHLLLGNLLKEKKNYTEAETYYQNSLRINTRIGDKRGEIATLYELAELHKNLGNLDLAKGEIEKAIDVVESSRINIDIQRLRTTYFAKSHLFYEFYIDLLIQLSKSGFDEYAVSAFNFSEKSRSRTFLDTLSQPTIYNQNSELISLENSQRSLLNRKVNELVVLKRDGLLEKIPLLEKEIESIRLELEKIEGKIKTDTSIRFSNHFKPLTLKTIQEKVLDSDTALFEYFLGEDQSFLWVVTKNSINTYKLPKRQTIEALAKALDNSIKVRTESTVFTENYEIIKADKNYIEAAHELSKIIIQPFLTNLNCTRILIAADECLNYVSFATLPVSNLSLKNKENLLISKFEIINVPSASSLVVLREKITEPTLNAITIVADPAFDLKDERVSKKTVQSKDTEIALRSLERGGMDFPRLPLSKTEAENIINLATKANYQCFNYLGFDAEIKKVLASLTKVKIAHFATHGVSKTFQNGLSGIVLSLVDETGNYIDGILSVDVITNLNVNTELVTLSACETALGEEFAGEGPIGIARAFMYAGAKRAVVSLWKVDDEATSKLMTKFYSYVFTGHSYSDALRLAQIDIRKNAKWKHPFFWGAFIIQGEYK